MVDIASGDGEEKTVAEPKPKGSAGGLVGGKARARALTPEQRSEIARKAAAKRWNKG